MSIENIFQKQKKLEERMKRVEWTLNQESQELAKLKAQVQEEFGTSDLQELRVLYSRIKRETDALKATMESRQALIEQALDALEKGEVVPDDVIEQLHALNQDPSASSSNQSAIEKNTEALSQAAPVDSNATAPGLQGFEPEFTDNEQGSNADASGAATANPLSAMVDDVKASVRTAKEPAPASNQAPTQNNPATGGVGVDLGFGNLQF